MTENIDLVSGILGEKFNMEMVVPQRSKEQPKTSERLPVSLPVTTTYTKNNTEDRVRMDNTV